MRRCIQGVSALGVLLVLATGAWAQNIRVTVNGQPVYFEGTQPTEVNGRVLVPLRGVLEQMGAYVEWVPSTQTVIATEGDKRISLPIGSRWATVNGERVGLDVPAMTLEGRTMVPLRFVGESLGADVAWIADNQTVVINTGNAVTAEGDNNYRTGRAHRTGGYYDQNGNWVPNGGVDRGREDHDRYYRDDNGDRRRREHRAGAISWTTFGAGTVVPVRLDDSLSSDGNQAGDRFTATVDAADNPGLPDGTRFVGVVREAIPARNGRPGVLDVDFRRVEFPDGTSRVLDASVTGLDSKYVTRTSSGRLVARPGSSSNERLKWVGIGAGAGLLVSTIAHGNQLLDTLLGAGAGYLYNELQNRGASNVRLRSGSEIGVRLVRPVQLEARS